MATLYVSPNGSGDRSGSSWSTAATINTLDLLIDAAGPGGQVLLRADAGSYRVTEPIVITSGGGVGRPVIIRGVDRDGAAMHAVITGSRPNDWSDGDKRGNELFKLLGGADNLKFVDLDVENTGVVFRAGADISRITIDDVDARNVARFFENWASAGENSATVTRLTMRDVEVTGFSEGAIRLRYDTNKVTIRDVHADAAGRLGDSWISGVQLEGTVHDVLIDQSSMRGAQSTGEASSYWNGDGFAAERGVYQLRIEDSVAHGNTDAGFDLKSSDTLLVRTLSENNGRNYRFWGEAELIDSIGLNPMVRGGSSSQNQIWLASGAEVLIQDSQFRDANRRTVVFEGKDAIVAFDDVDVWRGKGTRLTSLYDTTIKGLNEIDDHLLRPDAGAGGPSEFLYMPTHDSTL